MTPPGAPEDRDFQAGVTHSRAEVVAMQLQEPFADDQAQPEKERVGGLAEYSSRRVTAST